MKNFNCHITDPLPFADALRESPTHEAEKTLEGATISVRHSIDTDAVYVTIIDTDVNKLREHDVKSGKPTMRRSKPRMTTMEGFLFWSEGVFGIHEGWYPVGRSLTTTGMLSWLDHSAYIENMAQWCKLLILDLNTTLIHTRSGGPFMKDARDYYYRDDAIDFLTVLGMYGIRKVIATNQGGVAVGKLDEAEMEAELRQIAHDIGAEHYYVCYNLVGPRSLPQYNVEDDRRKPNPGMYLQAMKETGVRNTGKVLVVGDRDEDRIAAQRVEGRLGADPKFVWAKDFFRTRAENIEEEPADQSPF